MNYHIVAEADGFAPTTRLLRPSDYDGITWHQVLALEPGIAITGRVVDSTGVAIAGASITSMPPPRERTVAPYRPGLPDRMRPPVMSDHDGRFRYVVPRNQALVLVAKHPQFRATESAPLVASTPTEIELRLDEGRSLRGRVVDGHHIGIAGMTVTEQDHIATTDENGAFELTGLDPRQPQAMITAHDARRTSAPVLVALPEGFATPIELQATHELTLTGTVIDPSGAPVADAIISYRRRIAAYKPATPHPVTVLEPVISGEVRADGDGVFSISALAAGDYDVAARKPIGELSTTLVAHAGDSIAIQLAATARIHGRAIARNGQPVQSFDVAIRDFRGPHHIASDDGRFEIDDVGAITGSYVVRLSADGFAARDIDVAVSPGGAIDLGDVVLDPGRKLRGQVRDSVTGVGIWNAVVTITAPDGAAVATARSDEVGQFSAAVPLMPLVVHAAAGGVGGSRFVAVASDRTDVSLSLPDTGRLDVSVGGVDTTTQVAVTATRTEPGDGGFRTWILDREGTSFHGELSPGHYLVRAGPQPRFTGGGVAITIEGGDAQHVSLHLGARAPSP